MAILDSTSCTVDQAAEVLGISRSAAYAAAKSGELPTIRIGRRFVVPTAELRRMLRIDVSESIDSEDEHQEGAMSDQFAVTWADDGVGAHVFVMFDQMPIANGMTWQQGPLSLDQAEELASELLVAIETARRSDK
jgi:excisionase family DNA binding protein